MVHLYYARREFPRKFGYVKKVGLADGTSYRMRSKDNTVNALFTLEAFVTKRPGDEHYLDIIQTNIQPNTRALMLFSDLGVPREIKMGEFGYEDSIILQKEAEYDFHFGRIGRFISPLFLKLKESDVDLVSTFPAIRPYLHHSLRQCNSKALS